MDFHGMKRKQLQSLCKKHGIPANLKNKEMAYRLSLILKGKENLGSCQSGSDNSGTEKGNFHCISDKDMLDVEINELNSGNDNGHQMVASGAREVKSVSSRKRSSSPDSEEKIGFSPKLLKDSEIEGLESRTNSAPGIRDYIGTCDMEESMQSGVNEEQVNDSHEVLHAVPNAMVMNDVNLVLIALQEFGNHLVEGEVDKLGDNTDVHGDVCGTGKDEAEAEKQDDTNSPQGSNRSINIDQMVSSDTCEVKLPSSKKPSPVADPEDCFGFSTKPLEASVIEKLEKVDNSQEVLPTTPNDVDINNVNLLQFSPQASGYHWVEGEVHKSDDNICFHGGVCNIGNGGSEADTMCPNIFTGAKDTHGKTNVTAEHFLNEVNSSSCKDSARTPDQFLPTYPPSEVKSSNLNIHQMVTSDICEGKLESSQKTGLVLVADPVECIGFSPMHLEASVIKGFEAETNLNPSTLGDETQDEFVPTMPQPGEMKSCNLNIHQIFASDAASGDEEIDGGKLELSPKSTPVTNSKESFEFPPKLLESSIMKGLQTKTNLTFETCDMKENMQSIKKEQVGTFISKETIPKRQALQDLQQK